MAEVSTDSKGVIVPCPRCGRKNRIPFEKLNQTAQCGNCHAAIPPPGVPVEVAHEEDFNRLIETSLLPVLVDFWAPWCGPCRMVAPEMEKVAARHAGRFLVAKVNTEALPHLAARYDVMSIPTLAVFAGGRLVNRMAGALPAPNIEAFAFQSLGVTAGR